ncbi:DUF5060 domain-containing protein [Candidatus Latescibacterota bacterium]
MVITRHNFRFLLIALFLFMVVRPFVSADISGELMQWHKVVLTFSGPDTSENANPNPFSDYRLDVTFTGPSAQVYKVPGFYAADGNAGESSAESGNKWRVHFTPDEAGTWKYSISFVTGKNIAAELSGGSSAGYFNGETGSFSVTATDIDPNGKDYRGKGKVEYVGESYLRFKGTGKTFIKAGANGPETFLEFADFDNSPNGGNYTPHVGDWNTGDPAWKGGKGKGLIGLVNYLASFDNNVFYFLTMNAEGDGKDAWPWTSADSEGMWRYDCSKLDQWDIVFSHFDTNGLMINFVLSETENESLFEQWENGTTGGFATSRKIYYRELVARFGYHMAITWNIGEENGWAEGKNSGVDKAVTSTQRKQFADRLRALTYYNDNIVVHNGPSDDDHIFDDLLGHTSLTGISFQWNYSTNIYDKILQWVERSNSSGHKWVVSLDEPWLDEKTKPVDEWRKQNVWETFMAGGAGIELFVGSGKDVGSQSIKDYGAFYTVNKHALHFFNKYVPVLNELSPAKDFVSGALTLKKNGECYVLYLPVGGSVNLNLPAGDYSVKWFDPRNGGELHNGTVNSFSGSGSIGNPPDSISDDWAVLIMK